MGALEDFLGGIGSIISGIVNTALALVNGVVELVQTIIFAAITLVTTIFHALFSLCGSVLSFVMGKDSFTASKAATELTTSRSQYCRHPPPRRWVLRLYYIRCPSAYTESGIEEEGVAFLGHGLPLLK
jgi:hypothetical protein